MILDTLDRLESYAYLSPLMGKVVEFFHSTDLSTLTPGRIVLQGDDLFGDPFPNRFSPQNLM